MILYELLRKAKVKLNLFVAKKGDENGSIKHGNP